MATFFDQLYFSISIAGPICLMIILGVVFKRIGLINENFIDVASKLVFKVTLPAMLFLSIVTAKHDFSAASKFVTFGIVASIIFFVFTTLWVNFLFKGSADKGVIVQGGYRANTAIIGLAYVANAYGDTGVAAAALYVAAHTFLYNILAVICLTPKGETSGLQAGKIMFTTLTKNPLVIAIVLGMIFYLFSIPVPEIAVDAGNYFARMTLPLALLCTGGSLDLGSMKNDQKPSWVATIFKLVIAPTTITTAAYLFGFRGLELGIVFFMNAAPVAAASYVMARAMNGNSVLAANIIALTTAISTFTCAIGIMILSYMQAI